MPGLRASAPFLSLHPAVVDRRVRDLTLLGLVGGLLPCAIALGIALKVPDPNLFALAGVVAGTLGVVALMLSTRYEATLAILAIYLGTIDGVIKLTTGSQATSSIRDLLIGAITLGALVRLVASRERIRLPPLSGWVIAFVALVVIEAANPELRGIPKLLAGFKQHLEWIPFFFFGYLLMRSKERFRKFFLLLGVIALANGVVSTIQTQLTPSQLASWGPGYAARINGTGSVSGRVYTDSRDKARVRPPGLGSDLGFGGGVGVLALPGILALLAAGGLSRRSPFALLLFVGALVAIVTSLQRTDVLGAVVAVIAFALLSLSVGRKVARPLAALLIVASISMVVISVLSSSAGQGVFSRYASISPDKAASTSYSYRVGDISEIPADINSFPFGAGLATAGAARTFGGVGGAVVDGHVASAESQYNYITLELGLPGLLLWVSLTVALLVLVIRRIRLIPDIELRLSLAGVFAVVIAFTMMGFAGPTMSNLPYGPFFWFAVGIAAYWFGGAQRRNLSGSGGAIRRSAIAGRGQWAQRRDLTANATERRSERWITR
ncbi:MAG TPA: O-antigen ligase family protein [Solirubrobacteraceae bacterium]|nr:O-antigen ligase family protein [Solirubrobacteraceae bacterium]